MRIARAWLGRVLVGWLAWQVLLRGWRKLRPRPRPAWFAWEPGSRLRRWLWPADALLPRLPVQPGMRVLEVGAGASYLTLALAEAVGPAGHVIAVDENLGVVEDLQIDMLGQGLQHVAVQQAPPTTLPAAAGSVDVVVLTSAFGGVPAKDEVVREAYRVLKPGGAIVVTELLTDPDYCLASTVVTHLILGGFGIEQELGNFAGYTVIGRKTLGSLGHHL